MKSMRGRWLPLGVLVAAVLALAGVGWATVANSDGFGIFHHDNGPGGHGFGGRPGPMGIAGDGPVRNLDEAASAAQHYADTQGLRVEEVMGFDNNYYAELADSAGNLATEVLVDPDTGAVTIEPGPAMMWNTRYGMHHASGALNIDPEQAQRIADEWLAANRSGLHAGEPESFPGYYTLHTLRGEATIGMMSVNATTGDVWYHTWHGTFTGMRDIGE